MRALPRMRFARHGVPALLAAFTVLLMVSAVAAASPAAVEEPRTPATDLRFRRVFAPADHIQDWPMGGAKFVPIEAAEFERLVAATGNSTPDLQARAAVRAAKARYEARLVGEKNLTGVASIDVIHAAKTGATLSLDPCNLALGRPRWEGAEDTRASLGTRGNGKLELLVERSGLLRFDWSLSGRRDADGSLLFDFRWPMCPINQLVLDLPEKLVPKASAGIVVDSSPGDDGQRRWHIETGGRCQFQLRISAADAHPSQPSTAALRQSIAYEFTARGVELTADWKLESPREPLGQIHLKLESPLRLLSATCNDQPVPWSVSGEQSGQASSLLLVLPQPIHQGSGVLHLWAVAPLQADQSWRLPRILAENVSWQEGSATLVVPATFALEQVQGTACRQSAVSVLPPPRSGESLQFEYFAQDAALDVLLAPRRPLLSCVSATSTFLGNGKMTARAAVDVRASDGTTFALEAALSPSWTIDTVDALPVDGLEDWAVETQGDQRRLVVHLSKPLTADHGIRIICGARRLYSSSAGNLQIDDVVPLRLQGAANAKRLVALQAAESYQVRLQGGAPALTVQSLSAADLDLFGDSPGELLLADDSTASATQIALEKRNPNYTATLRVEATVVAQALREEYRLQVVPAKSAQVDHVVVRFSPARPIPPHWSLAGDEGRQPIVRQLPAERSPAGGSEVWELSFRQPQSGPFEIRAWREVHLASPLAISLAAMPDATAQQATLILRSDGGRPLQIQNNRLTSLATEPPPAGQMQTARATYQYDPRRDVVDQADPAIAISAGDVATTAPAWAWDAELISCFAANGDNQHTALFRLENAGAGAIRISLPSDVTAEQLQGVWIDKNRIPARWHAEQPGILLLDLPAGIQYPTVAIHWVAEPKPLGVFTSLQPPWPELDLPVLSRHWSVRVPPGYESSSFVAGPGESSPRSRSLAERLLGPLGRDSRQSPFNPLRRADWASLLAPTANAGDRTAPRPTRTNGLSVTAAKSWTAMSLPGYEPGDLVGWTSYRIEPDNLPTGGLVVRHRAAVDLLGWLVTLMIVGLGLVGRGPQFAWSFALAILVGLAALLVPLEYASLASSVLLGIILCGFARYCLGRRNGGDAPAEKAIAEAATQEEPPSTLAGTIPFAVPVLLAAMLAAALAPAAEPAPQADSAAYPVFVPVDSHQQPVGGKYYLPEALYEQLLRRATTPAEKPQGWLISAATYRAALAKESSSEQRLSVVDLTADLELQVFGAARVRIPFRQQEIKLNSNEVFLDGRPVQPEWEADGAAMLLEIPEAGQYHLELTLRPTTSVVEGQGGFDLAIPPVARARLEVTVPSGAASIEVPSAFGAVTWTGDPPRLAADLGATDRLHVCWQSAAGDTGEGPRIDAEQLLWLKVRPGSLIVDARFRLRTTTGQIHNIELAVDPELQMLPLAGAEAPSVHASSSTGQSQKIEVRWPRPVSEAVVLDARFVWTRASSIGNLRLPHLEVLGVRPTKRWLAVSVDPSLEYKVQGTDRLESVTPPEFSAAWGASEASPLMAYRQVNGTPWSMATRPRKPETTVDQTVALVAGGKEVAVRYDAQVTTSAGYIFQHRLMMPPTLAVERVSIVAGGTERTARWSQDKKGLLTVFLSGPVSGRHDLMLRGRLPIAESDNPLGIVTIEDARVLSSTIRLLRQTDSLVDCSSLEGATELKELAAENGAVDAPRVASVYRLDGPVPAKATFKVSPNRPHVRAEQIIRVLHDENVWKAVVECRLHVSDGVLDEVRYDVAGPWNGPYKSSPAATLRVSEGPAEERTIIVRPRLPISGDYRFNLSSPLDLAPSDRLAVPRIALHAAQTRRYLVLPRQADEQPLRWETDGLRPGTIQEFANEPGTVVYEAVGDSYHAVVQGADATGASPQVRLADIRIAWKAGGDYRGVATFEVEPGKRTEYSLWLPAGCQILQVSVSGVPTDPVAVGPGQWLLRLIEPAIPQRIEAVFVGQESAESVVEIGDSTLPLTTQCRLRAPRIGGLPVAATHWTIAAPAAFLATAVAEDSKSPDAVAGGPLQQSKVRSGPARPATASRMADGITQWESLLDDSWSVVRYNTVGASDAISIRYQLASADPFWARLLAATALLAMAAVAVVLDRRGYLRAAWMRWPYAVAVILGIVWWLWLWPSLFGVLLIAAALLRQFCPWPAFLRGSARKRFIAKNHSGRLPGRLS